MKHLLIFALLLATSMGTIACDKPTSENSPSSEKGAAVEAKGQRAVANATIYRLVPNALVSATVIKNGTAPVTGTFDQPAGMIEVHNGAMNGFIGVNTANFDTKLDVRDRNIQTAFFRNSTDSATAKVSLEFKGLTLPEKLPATIDVPATIDGFGVALPVTVTTTFNLTAEGMTIEAPSVVVPYASLPIAEQVAALMELCGHESIGDSVTIAFKGVFQEVKR